MRLGKRYRARVVDVAVTGGGPAVTDYCVERRFSSKIVARLRYDDEMREDIDGKDDSPMLGNIGDRLNCLWNSAQGRGGRVPAANRQG